MGGWPRLLISLALPAEWVPRSFAFCAKGRVTTNARSDGLRGSTSKRKLRPALIDAHRPSLPQKIETITAPAPLLRSFHQPSFYRIAMYIPQLLHALLGGPHVKVIETSLPERAPTEIVPEQAALPRVASFAPG